MRIEDDKANDPIQDASDSWARPIVTVDVAILTLRDGGLRALMMQRGANPFHGAWALPGGFIHTNEDVDLEFAARRVLKEKTGIQSPYLEQLGAFGSSDRDPRGWAATFAYFALIPSDKLELRGGANADGVAWLPVDPIPSNLAFDHSLILAAAVKRVRDKVEYSSLPIHLLPEKFTLPELQSVYEEILGRRLDKSAFRKRMAEANFVEPVAGERRMASNRPAQIYSARPGVTTYFDRTL